MGNGLLRRRKSVALADETTTLQIIMQGLRDNLVEITDGLLVDDFELVERGASAIANHPRIPHHGISTSPHHSNRCRCAGLVPGAGPWLPDSNKSSITPVRAC